MIVTCRPLRVSLLGWPAGWPLTVGLRLLSSGWDPAVVLGAPARAAAAELAAFPELAMLLAPTGEAVASLFAHTAVMARLPQNAAALSEAGLAFGRLVHLLDAVQDLHSDRQRGRFNPLVATGTSAADAQRLADELGRLAGAALSRVEIVDRALVDALFGAELTRAIRRALPAVPRQRGAAADAPSRRNPRVEAVSPWRRCWLVWSRARQCSEGGGGHALDAAGDGMARSRVTATATTVRAGGIAAVRVAATFLRATAVRTLPVTTAAAGKAAAAFVSNRPALDQCVVQPVTPLARWVCGWSRRRMSHAARCVHGHWVTVTVLPEVGLVPGLGHLAICFRRHGR